MMSRFLAFQALLTLMMPVTGCSLQNTSELPADAPNVPQDTISMVDTLHYLALGDSYTIGQSVNYDDRFPVQLVNQLRSAGVMIADPVFIARTGWTTTQLKTAIAQTQLKPGYDLVSLLIGVNNQYQKKNIEIYRQEFRELLETALSLAGGDASRVIVLSIPDYAYTPFGRTSNSAKTSQEIDLYNAINLGITKEYNIAYFDITPISREGLDDPALIAGDQLHPSGKMYSRWVDLIFNYVKVVLAE